MKHVLYINDACPYCHRVLRFMENNGVTGVDIKNIYASPENRAYLIEKGGMNQVPCLFIDEQPLYESLDIIDYMKRHLLSEEKDVNEDIGPEPNYCTFD
ncbi:MAG: glutaredoxin [Ndongobacter sp.]|nr:glutaredoxin [Ndongobacter sp.]